MNIRSFGLIFCTAASLLMAYSEEVSILSRSNSVPVDSLQGSDQYFEGYVQALVDMHYYEYSVVVLVKDRKVWLANLPKNKLTANSIVSFVKDIPGVKEVVVLDKVPPKDVEVREKYVQRPQLNGIWFPQMTVLFQPLLADPRQVCYSLGYRAGDEVIGVKTIAVSLGDDFPIYRWLNIFNHGDLQVGIEAGIWSVFNLNPHPNPDGGTELVNTDFYCGIPLTYAYNQWSFRFRIYHISSHLGDEYMVNHPETKRLNPSIEATDLYVSYQLSEAVRFYGGAGAIVHSDETYPEKPPLYFGYGTEVRFLGSKFLSQRLFGTCYLAIYLRNVQWLGWDFDGTYRLGYEFSKLAGIGRKLRVYVGYHHGFSLEGQFQKERTHYFEFSFSYGF